MPELPWCEVAEKVQLRVFGEAPEETSDLSSETWLQVFKTNFHPTSNQSSKVKNCHKIASAYMIHDEAVTALAFQSGTLIVGFEDGQVKFFTERCQEGGGGGCLPLQSCARLEDDLAGQIRDKCLGFIQTGELETFIELMWIHQLIVNRSLYSESTQNLLTQFAT